MEETKLQPLLFNDDRRLTLKERAEIKAHGHARAGLADNRGKLAKGIRNDRYLMVTGPQVHCPRPKLYQDRPRILQGAAFAYIRVNRHDIRPELLTLAGGQKSCDLPRVIEYCRNYMRIACERQGIEVAAELQARFVALALKDWLYKSLAQTQAQQAKKMRMRNTTFGMLYGIISHMLARRYQEACARHKQVLTGTSYRPPSVKLINGLEKRFAVAADWPTDEQIASAITAPAIAAYKPRSSPTIHLRHST